MKPKIFGTHQENSWAAKQAKRFGNRGAIIIIKQNGG